MISDRRVKIVATIGPAIASKENLKKAISCGMNVARLNFSHGSHDDHKKVISWIRELSEELSAPVTLLQDLQGPKIRVGQFAGGAIELQQGEIVQFSPDFTEGLEGKIPVDFDGLPESCRPGMKILLDDGLIELVIKEVKNNTVFAEVVEGGELKNRKGMNVPGAKLPIECLTEKDLADLEFGLSQCVDYVALSFVRQKEDMYKLREIVSKSRPETKLIAKIEMKEALEDLEAIIDASDAVMVARGDLAVEVGSTMLPGIQKKIIKQCNEKKCPVITATQMLDSMVSHPQPTRAEITDVANAVLDGSDALMLSAETAAGKYPFKCINTMSDIIQEVEKDNAEYYNIDLGGQFQEIAESIAVSACLTASKLDAKAIVCLTTTGKTATMISSHRPKAKVIALTHLVSTLQRLQLVWGMQTFAISEYSNLDEVLKLIEKLLVEYRIVKKKDKVIVTMGLPIVDGAKTNTIRVFQVEEDSVHPLSDDQLPLRLRQNY